MATSLWSVTAAWNYYQSVDTQQNKQFVSNFKAYCKKNNLPDGDKRVTDDPIEAAISACISGSKPSRKPGRVKSTRFERRLWQQFLAPGGEIMMDAANHHTHRPCSSVRSWRTGSSSGLPFEGAGEAGTLERIYEPGQGLRLGRASRNDQKRKSP